MGVTGINYESYDIMRHESIFLFVQSRNHFVISEMDYKLSGGMQHS